MNRFHSNVEKYSQSITVLLVTLLLAGPIYADESAPSTSAGEDGAAMALRILPEGDFPNDARKTLSRMIISGHPFVPPTSRSDWENRRRHIRNQVLIANGLWPMPARPPVQAVIHDKIQRNGYTIEKVYFESLPGHFVCGNLYRPLGKTGRAPAVLFPHGHFGNGHLQESDSKAIDDLLENGGEQFRNNARFPVQAPLAMLARLGCVVFQYDMVGRGDSRAIKHGQGYDDAEAILRLQSFMGLQTWNSLRALDFLCGLSDVDSTRIGVTGASGGGTQTILLCAIDDRPACAFPAVMVSISMQGGCKCENTPLLRIGLGNVDIAACFAPKPLGMTNANDWTLNFERKGFPELRELYAMLGHADRVMVQRFPQYKHNFNQPSREVMYGWMNTNLKLGASSTLEQEIDPAPPAELSVFDAEHQVTWLPVDRLRQEQTRLATDQIRELAPKTPDTVRAYQDSLRTALEVMVGSRFPAKDEIIEEKLAAVVGKDYRFDRVVLSRVSDSALFPREAVPTGIFRPIDSDGKRLVIWIHERGHDGLLNDAKTQPSDLLSGLLRQGITVISPDVLLTGEHVETGSTPSFPKVSMENPRFTLTYNRSVLANRVHDILTVVGYAAHRKEWSSIDLVGFHGAGPWVVLARCLCRDRIRRTVADCNEFSFATLTDVSDPMMLPGGLKYGDLLGLARVIAPAELCVQGLQSLPPEQLKQLRSDYLILGKGDALTVLSPTATQQQIIERVTRP